MIRASHLEGLDTQAPPEIVPLAKQMGDPEVPRASDFGLSEETPSRYDAYVDRKETLRKATFTLLFLTATLIFSTIYADSKGSWAFLIIGFLVSFMLLGVWAIVLERPTAWIVSLLTLGERDLEKCGSAVFRYRSAVRHFAFQAEQRKRDKEAEAHRRDRAWWAGLSGYQFEEEVFECLQRRGFQGRVTPGSRDGGVDIDGTLDGRRMIVQCKAHSGAVGPSVVRDLFGAMHHVGADHGLVVSLSGYTVGAQQFATGKAIRLLSVEDLICIRKGDPVPLY